MCKVHRVQREVLHGRTSCGQHGEEQVASGVGRSPTLTDNTEQAKEPSLKPAPASRQVQSSSKAIWRSIWQRGAAARATGITSEVVPARTGRVLGSYEAAVPRASGCVGVPAHTTAFMSATERKHKENMRFSMQSVEKGKKPFSAAPRGVARPRAMWARGADAMATHGATLQHAYSSIHRSRTAFNSSAHVETLANVRR